MTEPIEDKKIETPPAEGDQKPPEAAPSHNPLDEEIKKIEEKKEGRTKREKLNFTLKRVQDQLKELDEIEGINPPVPEEDEDKPVTVGMLKQLKAVEAQQTAVELAETEITDEKEKILTKHYLQNSIKPTGNPKEDLKLARAIVNSLKNSMIAEEASRKGTGQPPRNSGMPPKHEDVFEPTPAEASLMRPPFNLSKDDILKSRKASQK